MLEFSCFFCVLFNLLELLFVKYLVFESSFHYIFSYFFNALYKKSLQLIFLSYILYLFKTNFLELDFFFTELIFQGSDCIVVVCLNSLNVLHNFFLDLFLSHLWLEDQLDKLFKLYILSWNISISWNRTIGLWPPIGCDRLADEHIGRSSPSS